MPRWDRENERANSGTNCIEIARKEHPDGDRDLVADDFGARALAVDLSFEQQRGEPVHEGPERRDAQGDLGRALPGIQSLNTTDQHCISLVSARLERGGGRRVRVVIEHEPEHSPVRQGVEHIGPSHRAEAGLRVIPAFPAGVESFCELVKTGRGAVCQKLAKASEVMARSGVRHTCASGHLPQGQRPRPLLLEDQPRCPEQRAAQVTVMVAVLARLSSLITAPITTSSAAYLVIDKTATELSSCQQQVR